MGSFSIVHWLIVLLVPFSLYGAYNAGALRLPWLFLLCVVIWPVGAIYGVYRCFQKLPEPVR